MDSFLKHFLIFHVKERERERDGGREAALSRDVRAGGDTRDGRCDEEEEDDDDEGFYERGGGRVDLY